jgi:small-conductance mechanosensitive channel
MVVAQIAGEAFGRYTAVLTQLGEFALVTVALYLIGRVIIEPVVQWLFERRQYDETLERAFEKVLRVGVTIGAAAIGAWVAGLTAVLGGSALVFAALTLAVGFAAQDVLSNFVAGIFIVQDPNFNIDDWIEWNDRAGFIEDIGFRVTRIRTFDNETITVPNTELATTAVTNRMSNEQLRISYSVGIGYGDDISETVRILTAAAEDDDGILSDPAPSVRVTDLGDNAVFLQARFWISDPDREDFSALRSQYIERIKRRCDAAGIDLSTTTQHDITGELAVRDPPSASS